MLERISTLVNTNSREKVSALNLKNLLFLLKSVIFGSPKETLHMQRRHRTLNVALVAFLSAAYGSLLLGQVNPAVPSRQEIDELASKADQKIKGLRDALTAARPDIERYAPDLF